jgi:four helix bundle protein
MANIEGFGRESKAAFANFLGISLGSLREAEALVLLSERLRAPKILTADLLLRADDVGKATYGLRRSVKLARPRGLHPTTDDRA